MTIEPKECEACGEMFTPTVPHQKYCPDCGRNGRRIKRRYEKQIARSRHYEQLVSPRVYDKTCKVCGKSFKTTYPERFLCSDACMKTFAKQKMVCANCGKRITDVIPVDQIPDSYLHKRKHFCCPECEQEYEKNKFPARICKYCGKVYHSANKYYCCEQCRIDDIKPVKIEGKICQQCGKTYYNRNMKFCNAACQKEYNKTHKMIRPVSKEAKRKSKMHKKQQEAWQKTANAQYAEIKKKKLADYIAKNGCCGICCTPYSDCERMQSEFRIIPKGARYKDSKIVECPKFWTKPDKFL